VHLLCNEHIHRQALMHPADTFHPTDPEDLSLLCTHQEDGGAL
jgi:hypothetical protein